MFKCFANNQTLLLKRIHGYRSIFFESKGSFAEETKAEEKKEKQHKMELKTDSMLFSPSCLNDRFTCWEKNPLKIKCWESLEIRLDIWSPSEGTWSKAKDTPKNENDFIMRELSLDSDWIAGTISQAEWGDYKPLQETLYLCCKWMN